MANGLWTTPVPAIARTIATQPLVIAEWTNHSVNSVLLQVEQQWREANRLGLARNHGLSINTDETDAAR